MIDLIILTLKSYHSKISSNQHISLMISNNSKGLVLKDISNHAGDNMLFIIWNKEVRGQPENVPKCYAFDFVTYVITKFLKSCVFRCILPSKWIVSDPDGWSSKWKIHVPTRLWNLRYNFSLINAS